MIRNYFTETTLQEFESLMSTIWNGNRYFDRACSVLKVKFQMNNLEEVLHQEYAHYFPEFSDYMVGYLESFNTSVIYPETVRGDQKYDNVIELIVSLRDYFGSFINQVYAFADKVKVEDPNFYYYTTNISNLLHNKMTKLIQIENKIINSLRPDSNMREIIDLDNYVQWKNL